MARNSSLQAARGSLPGTRGLFLVTANGVPVQYVQDRAEFRGSKMKELPAVRTLPRKHRGLVERIRRALRAFWN